METLILRTKLKLKKIHKIMFTDSWMLKLKFLSDKGSETVKGIDKKPRIILINY